MFAPPIGSGFRLHWSPCLLQHRTVGKLLVKLVLKQRRVVEVCERYLCNVNCVVEHATGVIGSHNKSLAQWDCFHVFATFRVCFDSFHRCLCLARWRRQSLARWTTGTCNFCISATRVAWANAYIIVGLRLNSRVRGLSWLRLGFTCHDWRLGLQSGCLLPWTTARG